MTAEDETMLNDLLGRWEEARDRGEQPDPAELCRERPDLLGEFVDRVGALLWCEVLEKGPPAVEDGTVPDVLDGRYRVRGRLGTGNQGDVWRAYDPLIQREVAVKMPRVNGEHVLAEARMIASLRHSNIIKVLDAGHDPCPPRREAGQHPARQGGQRGAHRLRDPDRPRDTRPRRRGRA